MFGDSRQFFINGRDTLTQAFTLAHFSDPHLAPLPAPGVRALIGKRVLGYLSWKRRRQAIHNSGMLDALTRDVADARPDHVAITGDITNISLPAEFRRSANWLHALGGPEWISLVPGNHDTYVPMTWESSLAHWRDYMSCDLAKARPRVPSDFSHFPYVRLRGPIAVIGLSSACATPPFFASGHLGREQLARLGEHLEALGERDLFRVILVHHPPAGSDIKWRKRLVDAEAFRAVVAHHGAELVLHGHDHTLRREQIDTARGHVPSFGVPSASSSGDSRKPDARYQLYRISKTEDGWHLGIAGHGWNRARGRFIEDETFEVNLPR
jgi:3',5'-cyclic AMP phosphodiesterase CpdA